MIPEPTRALVGRLRRVAVLLDTIATDADISAKARRQAEDSAAVVWDGVRRLEDLAGAVEEMVPTFASIVPDWDPP